MGRAGPSLDYPHPCRIQYMCFPIPRHPLHSFTIWFSALISLALSGSSRFVLPPTPYLPALLSSLLRDFSLAYGWGTRLQISSAKNRTAVVTPKFDNGGRKECPHTCSLQT